MLFNTGVPPIIRVVLGLGLVVLVCTITLGARQNTEDFSAFVPLPREVVSPADNPTTPEKVELGRLLFWDPILSGAGDIACATCHHPDHAYTDGRDLPIGTGGRGLGPKRTFHGKAPIVKRNSQTILNVAFNGLVDLATPSDPSSAPMFWDVRAKSLEAQALGPIESLEEMRGPGVPEGSGAAAAVARIARVREYRERFARVFGGDDPVSVTNLGKAIAAFERTLITPDSRFDRYMRGDKTALRGAELLGMAAFRDRGCLGCHKGPMFSDYQVHVLGVGDHPMLPVPDTGVGERSAFRTPTLRNIGLTAPYMHNGMLDLLPTAVGFYQVIGNSNPRLGRGQLDPLLNQVNVRSQLYDLVDFLLTLEGPFDKTIPARVPSGLKVGGR